MNNSDSSVKCLQKVINSLVAPEGCEWDREQTPLTLCDYLLEESSELVDAIRHGTMEDVKEEMGDVFFLLFFILQRYSEKYAITLDEVLKESAAKMVRRHPHVFSDAVFSNMEEQLHAWEDIKKSEKNIPQKGYKGTYDSLPSSLSSLLKAYRIHSKAASAGFTWETDDDVAQQVEVEWLELIDAFAHGNSVQKEHEFGDVLFSLVELGRRQGLKANSALDFANARFLKRFQLMEEMAYKKGKVFSELSMEEKNSLWDIAKEKEKKIL